MKKNKTEKQHIHTIIVNGLREAIKIHGPITKLLIGSVTKRIAGALLIKGKGNIKKE